MENGDRLAAVKRRYLVVAVACVLGAALALFLAGRQHRQYAASSEVAVNQQSLPASAGGSVFASAQQLQRQVETLANVAASPAVAKLVLERVPGTGWTVDQLLARSSVEPSANADLLTIHVSAGSRGLAGELATAYAQAFAGYENNRTVDAIDTVLATVNTQIAATNRLIAQDSANGGQPTAEHRQTLSSLLNKKSDYQALKTSSAAAVTMLRGGTDAHQTAPRPLRSGLLGGLLGLVFGFALAFALDSFDRRVTSTADVEQLRRLPLLACVGRAPKAYARRDAVISLKDPDHAHAESYRMARTSLDLAMLRGSVRTIAISSAVQGEGKSTLAANLAVGFATSGSSVALVDLDLRRPTIARLFELPAAGPGVGQVLRGELRASACLQRISLGDASDGNGCLDVLSSRSSDRSHLPYLTRASLARLVEELSQSHDLILFDTPPLLAVSDPAIVAAAADAMLVVVRAGVARKPAVADLAQLLSALDVRVLGYMLNAATQGAGYGYGYAYGYRAAAPPANGGQLPPPGNPGLRDLPLVPADLDA
jgi:capsular exopolysaccharide synthesis family protein